MTHERNIYTPGWLSNALKFLKLEVLTVCVYTMYTSKIFYHLKFCVVVSTYIREYIICRLCTAVYIYIYMFVYVKKDLIKALVLKLLKIYLYMNVDVPISLVCILKYIGLIWLKIEVTQKV